MPSAATCLAESSFHIDSKADTSYSVFMTSSSAAGPPFFRLCKRGTEPICAVCCLVTLYTTIISCTCTIGQLPHRSVQMLWDSNVLCAWVDHASVCVVGNRSKGTTAFSLSSLCVADLCHFAVQIDTTKAQSKIQHLTPARLFIPW